MSFCCFVYHIGRVVCSLQIKYIVAKVTNSVEIVLHREKSLLLHFVKYV
jgi:hypothetical protein